MSKKILSIVLVLVLVLSMGTVALFTASASLEDLPEQPADTYRYYFYLPEKWLNDSTATTGNTAGIYWWEGTDACSAWPGYAANKADVDGVYYYDVPTDVTTIVWSNFFDGGADTSAPYYKDAIQTRNIGTEYYDPGESERYPDGTDNFDGMIYVVDFGICDYNDYSGKMQFGGDWFYYYGNGEYGTSEVKGESEIRNSSVIDPSIPMPDETLPTDPVVTDPVVTDPVVTDPVVTDPVVTDPVVTDPVVTDPVVTDPVVEDKCDTNITIGDETKSACIGETITYTMNLEAAELFEDFQATITYDAEILELATTKSTEACPNVVSGLIFNAKNAGEIKFNGVYLDGYDFTEEKVFVTLQFTVKAAGDATIDTLIEEMTMLTGDSYFTDGEPSVTEGITVTEELVVPEHPTQPVVTDPVVTDPVVTDPVVTDPVVTDPVVTDPVVTDPVVTDPVVTKPVVTEPVTTTPDATSATGTNATEAPNTPGTGATAYLYIALAVVAMAAAAVVVLRKKVNG